MTEALEVIESMHFTSGKNLYAVLLGACRIHNNLEHVEKVGEKLFWVDPGNADVRKMRVGWMTESYCSVRRKSDGPRWLQFCRNIGSLHHIMWC